MMSILVNKHGQVCVACDDVYEGIPSAVTFDPGHRNLTLQFDDGHEEWLGTAGQTEICRMLHKVHSIRFMQLRNPEPSYNMRLPLYVAMARETPCAAAR